jgi:hypothetical protein
MRYESVEVVVVTHNSARHIGPCVDSIVAAAALPVVVDNGSTDETVDIVRSKSREARVIAAGENLGYGKAMNLGFRETRGHFVVLSNPDVVFLADSISRMVEFLEKNPRIGITGPQQMFPNGSWQRSYGDLPGIWSGVKDAVGITTLKNQLRRGLWPRRIDRRPKQVAYLDGAVLAVRREAFLGANGFDEAILFSADDSDLCARLKKAGWGVVFFPEAQVIHIRGADSTKTDAWEQFVRFQVTSQFLLASKHLPQWKVRAYARLEVAHFQRLAAIYRLLRLVRGADSARDGKILMLNALVRIWRQHCGHGMVVRTESAN